MSEYNLIETLRGYRERIDIEEAPDVAKIYDEILMLARNAEPWMRASSDAINFNCKENITEIFHRTFSVKVNRKAVSIEFPKNHEGNSQLCEFLMEMFLNTNFPIIPELIDDIKFGKKMEKRRNVAFITNGERRWKIIFDEYAVWRKLFDSGFFTYYFDLMKNPNVNIIKKRAKALGKVKKR